MTTEQTQKPVSRIRIAAALGGLTGVVMLSAMTSGCAPGRTRDTVLLDSRGVMPPPYVQPEDIDREREPMRREPARPEPRVREEVAEAPLQPMEPLIPDDEPAEPLPPPEEEPAVREPKVVEEPEPRVPDFPEPEVTETELHTHTVQAGESLWRIGRRYDVSHRDIMAYNEIEEGDVLREGQELTLPPGARLDEETVREPEPEPDPVPRPTETEERELREGDKYTVRRGDSLSVIASDFGVNVNDIKVLNDLDSDRIFEGQTLIIPETDTEPEPEVAREPEPDEPAVDVDEELPTPEWELATDEIEDEPIPEEDRMDTLEHVVLEGETFADIGEMYDVDPNEIRRYNPDLDESDLEAGTTVDVPVY